MKDRNTQEDHGTVTHRSVGYTRHPGNIASNPDMIRLKELVGLLGDDRREALNAYLDDQDDQTTERRGDHEQENE